MTTVRHHVETARASLVKAGLGPEDAAIDAEVLARSALGWDRATYLTHSRNEAPGSFADRYRGMLERRTRREPVSLITGHREFWGLDFQVTSDVLTPRPETELLVEEALRRITEFDHAKPSVVDVGTGSGCVAIVITRMTRARVSATDVSPAALAVARQNAERHGVGDQIEWVCAPLLEGIDDAPDVIVANLPYIPESDMPNLPPEVREFEPRTALDGGHDGLQIIRQLVDSAARRLRDGGYLIVEVGPGQAATLARRQDAMPGRGALRVVDTREDLQGVPRVLTMQVQRFASQGPSEQGAHGAPRGRGVGLSGSPRSARGGSGRSPVYFGRPRSPV